MDPELEKEEVEVDSATGDIKATKLGLRRIKIALIAMMIGTVLSLLFNLYFEFVLFSNDFPSILVLTIYSVITGLVGLAIMLFYMVFLTIGVNALKRGSGSFSEQHRKNVNWARKLVFVLIAIHAVNFLIPFIIGFGASSMSDITKYNSLLIFINGVINAGVLIIWILILTLSIKKIAHKRMRDLIYIYGIGAIGIYIMMIPFTFISYLMVDLGEFFFKFFNIIFYLRYVISIAIMVCAIFAYIGTERMIKNPGDRDDRKGGILGRPPSISKYALIGLSNPVRLIGIFLVVGAILGGVNAYQYNSMMEGFFDFDTGGSDGGNMNNELIVEMEDVLIAEEIFSDTVMEDETLDCDINNYGPIVFVHAELIWTDEDDIRLNENKPDTFVVSIVLAFDEFGSRESSEMGENTQGGEGMLECDIPYADGGVYNYKNSTVSVTLFDAGDYEKIIGPGIIGYVDDSNAFTLTVEIGYITMEDYQERVEDM